MPALVAFNRRWAIGSDDFALSGVVPLLIRLVWFIVVAVIFTEHIASHNHFEKCNAERITYTYFSGFFTIMILTIIFEILIIYVSSRGTIIDTHPRRHIPRLLYSRLFLYIFEILLSILGIVTVSRNWNTDKLNCDNDVMSLMLAVVVLSWSGLLVNLITIFIKFDPLGHIREKEKRKLHKRLRRKSSVRSVFNVETPKALWERRCRTMCCNENAGEAFADVSSIFAQVFEEHDVVASDILAGLTLIRKEHKLLKMQGCMPKSSQSHFPKLTKPSQLVTDVLPRAVHYLQYAISSYGYLFYLFDNIACGICKLCRYKDCICCCYEDENCAGYNTAVVKETNGLTDDEIVYITYQNKIYEIPFFVAVDHKHKSIVISLRGTLSVEDALTDANADSALMIVDNQRMYAHKGILIVSQNVKIILDREKIIEKAYEIAESNDYELVVTGHSLGGGAAAILTILLKPDWPDIKCFSFACPGGLVSSVAVQYSRSFITTVILGSDLISRMSLESLEDIKGQLIKAVMETDQSKCSLLSQGCLSGMCGTDTYDTYGYDEMMLTVNDNQNLECQPNATSSSYQHLYDCDDNTIDETTGLTAVDEGDNGEGDNREGDNDEEDGDHAKNRQLFLPGQILWIKKISEGIERNSCCGKRQYVATWAKHEDFSSILVKPSMVTDHVPYNLMNAIHLIINDNRESHQQV